MFKPALGGVNRPLQTLRLIPENTGKAGSPWQTLSIQRVKAQYAERPPDGNQETRGREMFLKGLGKGLIQQKFLGLPAMAELFLWVGVGVWGAGPEVRVSRAGHGIDGKPDGSSK